MGLLSVSVATIAVAETVSAITSIEATIAVVGISLGIGLALLVTLLELSASLGVIAKAGPTNGESGSLLLLSGRPLAIAVVSVGLGIGRPLAVSVTTVAIAETVSTVTSVQATIAIVGISLGIGLTLPDTKGSSTGNWDVSGIYAGSRLAQDGEAVSTVAVVSVSVGVS